jgi:RHS repeat-associated protein
MLQQHEHTRHPASFPSRPGRPRRDCCEGSGPRRAFHPSRRLSRRGSECRKSLLTPGSNRVKRPDRGGPLFDAQYTSSDTGLIYLRARVYDPATAQFLTVDPLNQFTRAPYNYAQDNPLNLTDAAGLEAIPLPAPVAGGCAAAPEICGGAAVAGVDAWLGVKVFNAWAGSEEAGNDEGEAELKEKEAERSKCGNPATPPGSKLEWKGKGPVGSNEGSWWDPDADESLYPHLGENSHGPHYDYEGPSGNYRIYPDGRIEAKP